MIGFIGTSLQLQAIITAHTLSDVCLTNVYEESLNNISRIYHYSLTNLRLISNSRIHKCTAFFNCHAAGIEVTLSNNSVLSREYVYRSVAYQMVIIFY
jgi:hypothetical protein